MDFYFTDRSFNLLGIASTSSQSPIQVINDVDDELAPNSVGRNYTATLVFNRSQIKKVLTMAELGNFVLYKDYRDRYLFMTIMEWTSSDPYNGKLTFVAENGGIDLINETVGAYTATKAMPIADYINRFIADSGFEIGINEIPNLTRTLTWDSDGDTSLARIESVATQFDNAELDFRFEISGTSVVKRYIDIYKHIGSDKGQRLEVNTHLNSIVTTGNIYDLYTSVVATGGTPEGADKPITLAGYKWTDPNGRYVLTSDGVLMDTQANQKWSRLGVGGKIASNSGAYINRVITYEATTQATLLQSALTGLKKATNPEMNYDVDIVDLPNSIDIGDTVHAVDEIQDLNLSTRLLELKTSYADDSRTATLGDYLIEANQVDPAIQDIADQLKFLKETAHWYPWTMYADDDQGTGISSLPLGKTYMAVVWGKTATPSDDPADYAGHWQKVTGADGIAGKDGVGVKSTQIMYAQSTSGTTAPTTGWTAQVPTLIKGQYLWTQTTWVYTDNTGESGYTVSYNAKDGNTGADGIAGKDGVGITATAVTYQASTSGTTAPTGTWSATPPTVSAGSFLWTRMIWTYTDGTTETGYSVAQMGKTGETGAQGERGKQVFKSSYDYGDVPNTSGHWWSDLSPAPSADNPPKIGDTIITPAGNIFQISSVNVGGEGGGGTFGVGDVLGNIQGPQGPKGSDITSYDSGTTLPSTVAPANSQFWLVDTNNVAIKFYKSNGSSWVEQQISAAAINAATFNGLTFNGVNFTGSKFTSTFSNIQPTGFAQTVYGTSTLADGSLVTDVYQDGTSTKISHNELNQLGMVTQQYVGDKVGMQALLGQGQLDLGGYFSPLAGGDPVWNESTLSARTLYLLNNTGKAIWNGVSLMGSDQTINAKVLLDNTLIGWVFQWSQYDTVANKSIDRNWTYYLVPKVHNIGHDPNQGWSVEMPIVIPNKGNFTKIVWISNSKLGGDNSGTTGLQMNACLRAIYAV